MDSDLATKAEPRALATTSGPDYGRLMEAAIQQGEQGVAALERIVALQERVMAQEAKQAFVQAMADLRAELPPITKTVRGQHGVKREGTRTRGMYAPLDSITPVLDPIAAKHGLSYRFDREVIAGREDDYMVCIVTHRQGHEERTRYPCPAGQQNKGTNALQAIAVGESYAKRYALIAAFGITTADPDDDAQSAGGPVEKITDEQALEIEAKAGDVGANVSAMLSWLGVEGIEDIPAARYAEVMKKLNAKARQAAQS